MHRALGVLAQARLDVVSASKDPEQARIDCCLIIGVLDQLQRIGISVSPRRDCPRA